MNRAAPDPSSLRFERRILLQDDVGRAFQQFAWEALSLSEFPDRNLIQHPVRGVDGGIDLAAEQGDGLVALECKFHSDSRRDSPNADWASIAKILKETLPELCHADHDVARRSPHFPWISRDRPLVSYWFCTSASLANQNSVDQLKDRIARDLDATSKLDPVLAHLADLEVQVRCGQHFAKVLSDYPPLRYRWFGGLPPGLTVLSAFSATTRAFRKFLHEACLPYFSFTEFARECGTPAESDFPDPHKLVAELLDGSSPALVISGRGGVGKTRLALEVASVAERRGIMALAGGQVADGSSITALAQAHIDRTTALIFVDYAEAHPNLASIGSAIEAVNAAGHDFRLITTCRASGASSVIHALEDLGYHRVILAGRDSGGPSRSYLGWVANRILEHGSISGVPGLAGVCAELPVLATFALHLSQSHPERFAQLFADLAAESSFEGWANRRIEIMLARLGENRTLSMRRMAEFAAILPLAATESSTLRERGDRFSATIDTLLTDGWIDEEDGALVAAHDVFADAIVAAYLFEPGMPVHSRAVDLVGGGHQLGALDRTLRSIDRLAGHSRFTDINGPELFRSIRLNDPMAIQSVVSETLHSRLLSPTDLIELIEKDDDLRNGIVDNRDHGGALAHLAKQVLKSGNDALRQRAAAVLRPLLEAAISSDNQPTNILLARSFLLDPQFFADRALAEMKANAEDHQTHFLIAAWLKNGMDQNLVADIVHRWLGVHAWTNLKSSFVLRAWLQFARDTEFVRNDVHRWLDRFGDRPQAEFVYSAWLHAGGPVAEVADRALRWLESYGEEADARYVYASWLTGRPDSERLAVHIRRWVGRHGRSLEASYVYGAWLRGGGSCDFVEDDIRGWLDLYSEHDDASHIYVSWLRAGGSSATFERDILGWLRVSGAKTVEASYVFAAWIQAGGGVDIVAPDVGRWLEHFSESLEARALYIEWLEAKHTPQPIADAVQRWLRIHAENEIAQQVACAWLRADCSPSAITPDVSRWLALHFERLDAGHLYRAWLEAGGRFDVVAGNVLGWLELHSLSPEAHFVYRAWLTYGGDLAEVERGVRIWFQLHGGSDDAEFLAVAWAKAGGDFDIIREISFKWLKNNIHNRDSVFLIKYIVRQTDLPVDVVATIATWCQINVDHPECITRMGPLIARYAFGELSLPLIEIALDVLEHIEPQEIRDDFTKSSILATIGKIAWHQKTNPEFVGDINYRFDAVHAYFLQRGEIYLIDNQSTLRTFARPVPVIHHVSRLLDIGFINPALDKDAIDRFLQWIENWPEDEKLFAAGALVRVSRRLARPGLAKAIGFAAEDSAIPRQSFRSESHPGLRLAPRRPISWTWKDDWWLRWHQADCGPEDRRILTERAMTWLGMFDYSQGGWTSVWTEIWKARQGGFADRVALTELAITWLRTIDVAHPRWVIIWHVLWSDSELSSDHRAILDVEAHNWLDKGGHVDRQKVLLALLT